ncbi:MAG: ABC transporter permease [Anaerolineaceae bacterium]|jgi:ribose/xylose/arabinose/galactoside ABC-type transport system permease subunit
MPDQSKVTRQKAFEIIGENGFILIFIIWVVILSLTTSTFLNQQNIFTVLRQAAIVSIVSIGEMLIMLLGGMDVSLGVLLGFSGIVAASLMVNYGVSPWVACLASMAVGTVIGLINGFLVTKVRINSVIATLGMMNVLGGMALAYTQGATIVGPQLNQIAFVSRGYIGPVPVPVILMFVFYIAFYFILNKTVFGAQIYAIGNNEKAAWLAGIKVDRMKMLAFMLAGLLAGFSGFMQASRQGSATSSMGSDFLFPILTAVILGGISLSGGKGRIQNTLIAAVFLMTITNGMVLLGISLYIQGIISGLILIFALSLDRLRYRQR